MNKFFNNLSIRLRTMISVSVIVLLLALSVYHAHQTLQAQVDFAVLERKGGEYLEPVLHMQHLSAKLMVDLTRENGKEGAKKIVSEGNEKFKEFDLLTEKYRLDLKLDDKSMAAAGKAEITPAKL